MSREKILKQWSGIGCLNCFQRIYLSFTVFTIISTTEDTQQAFVFINYFGPANKTDMPNF